ncbi:unnamed protein product [Lactuca virosa]|uniref:EF-hand domain-containing protein n=1 Tax=Lactuca virosa TaxID=75947 RepID=A0AAU9NB64_9ASTR|nr:unnamed protein product [Lactuca virosa]
MRIDKDEDGRITQDNVRKIISLSASINKIIERDVGFFYMEVHLVQGPSTLYCIFPRVLINGPYGGVTSRVRNPNHEYFERYFE